MENMIFIEGGTFMMGDIFGDGQEDEQPVHQVTLDGFYLAQYAVTVAQFRTFVEESGYSTSAEGPEDTLGEGEKLIAQYSSGKLTEQEKLERHERFLEFGGTGFWDADNRKWIGYIPTINWENPGFEQTDADPVTAVSHDDAILYCNWLSKKAGKPIAYDPKTGKILDENGNPTLDITTVKGYRLPTEAEWEYAAREGGGEVRFGNGKNIARSSEINFRGDEGEYPYLEIGEYAKQTKPVGSYLPNNLGLYDMSGNVWEWVSDKYATYNNEPQENPYITAGGMHALRGGRWGGDANEIRVFHRAPYPRNDRCNNSGFRIARSK